MTKKRDFLPLAPPCRLESVLGQNLFWELRNERKDSPYHAIASSSFGFGFEKWQASETFETSSAAKSKNDLEKKVTFSTFGVACRLGADLCQYLFAESRTLRDGTAAETIAPSETKFVIESGQASKKITASDPARPKTT
jgi:hypothetical protein